MGAYGTMAPRSEMQWSCFSNEKTIEGVGVSDDAKRKMSDQLSCGTGGAGVWGMGACGSTTDSQVWAQICARGPQLRGLRCSLGVEGIGVPTVVTCQIQVFTK